MNIKFLAAILILPLLSSCQTTKVNLSSDNLDLVKRNLLSSIDNTIALDDAESDGMAIIKDIEFTTGELELEIKGKNKPGQSFVGIAFNIQNDSIYEAVYFRPFNFQSDEKIRREHSIQYFFNPTHSWRYLRTNHEGVYEAEFDNPPDPDSWFSIRLIIEKESVEVVDLRDESTLLTVERLTNPTSNKIGLWTGFRSSGKFKNLRVTK